MTDYDPAAYGQALGAEYDALYPARRFDTDAAVAAIAALATSGDGSVLEFGIGTGRLALPLRGRGLRVAGIDASEAMVQQLRSKPGGDAIDVVVGDFTTAVIDSQFAVVVLAVNGITDPPTRDAQIACFRNAERHLGPGGCFVVENFVLAPEQLTGEWSILPRSVHHAHVEVQLTRYDAATSIVERTLVHLRHDSVRLVTVRDNYAWPGELDLMARAVGLCLRSRHAGWACEPFDGSSRKHVSVYERSDAGSTGSPADVSVAGA